MRLGRGSDELQTPTRRLEPTWAHLPSPRLAAEILAASKKPKAPAESRGRAGEEDGRGGRRTWPAGRAPGQGLRQERLVLGRRRRRREGCQRQLRDAAQAARPGHGRRGRGAARPRWALGSSAARPAPPRWPKQAGRPALGPTPLGRLGPSGFRLGPPLGRGGTGTPAGLQRGHPTDLRAPAPAVSQLSSQSPKHLYRHLARSPNLWGALTTSCGTERPHRLQGRPQRSSATSTIPGSAPNIPEMPHTTQGHLQIRPQRTLPKLPTCPLVVSSLLMRHPHKPQGHPKNPRMHLQMTVVL